jgi:glycerol kinase
MKIIAAIDQGTTSTRCLMFDQKATILSTAQMEHQQIYPQPGWVEHDPQEIWRNTLKVFREAFQKSNIHKEDIGSLGITNQRETTLLWNKKTGKAYGNAIVWQDTRTDSICSQLIESGSEKLIKVKTGLPIATYFSATKIKWMLDHDEDLQRDVLNNEVMFGNIDTWLIWNLTGGTKDGLHCTDVTNASRTMLMNLKTLAWDEEILSILGIPGFILPAIKPSSTHFGETRVAGLEGIPICGDLGDQQAALFGQACFEKGDAKNTYGTGCFMLLNSGEDYKISEHGLLTTLGYQIGNSSPVYCLEGSIAITGALVQWLRDNLKFFYQSDQIEKLASTVEDNGGIYFVPAFSGLFAPYWRSDARGMIIGLTRYANKGHIARSALEATAFQTKEILDAMNEDSGVALKILKVDGGMVKNELLMQFQADILDVPVIRPVITETTALGAAYAAGLAVGFWSSTDELKANWNEDKRWIPDMSNDQRNNEYRKWKRAVDRTIGWLE